MLAYHGWCCRIDASAISQKIPLRYVLIIWIKIRLRYIFITEMEMEVTFDSTSTSARVIELIISRNHYRDVIMSTMASQITSLPIVYPTVYSGADQRRHQSSASLASVWGIHRWPVNYPHKGPVMRKCFHLMTSSWTSDLLAAFRNQKITIV